MGTEIVLVWSWFSFIVGVVSAFVFSFIVLFGIAFGQWKKQQKAAKAQTDSVEKMFAAWGGRHNE